MNVVVNLLDKHSEIAWIRVLDLAHRTAEGTSPTDIDIVFADLLNLFGRISDPRTPPAECRDLCLEIVDTVTLWAFRTCTLPPGGLAQWASALADDAGSMSDDDARRFRRIGLTLIRDFVEQQNLGQYRNVAAYFWGLSLRIQKVKTEQ
jgi:hypothetical protein